VSLPQAITANKPGSTAAAWAARAPALPSDGRVAVLRDRAEQELRDLAADLHVQQIDPVNILLALHERQHLLIASAATEGVRLTCLPQMPVVRAECGLAPDWCPEAALRAQAEREVARRRRRALVLSDWLRERAGEGSAERVVRAAALAAAQHIEEKTE